MPRPRTLKPPQQMRSRESLRRMLEAAEHVVDQHGLEGATISRIAKAAGLSPANVYRRFPSKGALMRAIFRRASEINEQELSKEVDLEPIRKIGIQTFTRNWVSSMLKAYRGRTGLMRAGVQYSMQQANAAFVRRQRELEVRAFRKLVDTFLLWRDEIRHPDTEAGVRYAIVIIAFALRELILFDRIESFGNLVPLNGERLEDELSRIFLRYLGIEGS
jgi:AcrR family transcriptional regulator